jgi:hypothetical protein
MTVEEKLISLAGKLLQRTERKEVSWEESVEEDTFVTSFSQYSVSIRKVSSQAYAEDAYKLSLIDENGKTLEALELEADHGKSHRLLGSLYQTVRRHALGVEEALDNLLKSLD